MKFCNFLFPENRDPAQDEFMIDATTVEAKLTEQPGFVVVWLAEYHFAGICDDVDPLSFASVLAAATNHIKIGFAWHRYRCTNQSTWPSRSRLKEANHVAPVIEFLLPPAARQITGAPLPIDGGMMLG